ncbi:hypothetical protein BJV74DRAFT_532760 [Russula compacta]|nr:hypothetical protein BJV74DRAFT_532760 [Russula compacta]
MEDIDGRSNRHPGYVLAFIPSCIPDLPRTTLNKCVPVFGKLGPRTSLVHPCDRGQSCTRGCCCLSLSTVHLPLINKRQRVEDASAEDAMGTEVDVTHASAQPVQRGVERETAVERQSLRTTNGPNTGDISGSLRQLPPYLDSQAWSQGDGIPAPFASLFPREATLVGLGVEVHYYLSAQRMVQCHD